MPDYFCNTCQALHPAGYVCKEPILSKEESYKALLMRRFDSFAVGYGETVTVILGALRTRLFGDTYEK